MSEWVARAASFKHLPRTPKLLFTAASDLVWSLVILLERSLVGVRFLVRFRGFAFKFSGPLARLLHFSTSCFMSRTAIANFPEGATQFCTRALNFSAHCIVQGPATCKLLGGGDQTSQVNSSSSCRRSWSFRALSSSSPTSEAMRIACRPLQFKAPPSSWSLRRSRTPPPRCPRPAWSFG